MEKKYFTLVTDIGIREMMDAIRQGGKVCITEFAVGDGGGGYYVPSMEMSALRHEVWRSSVSECRAEQGSENILLIEAVMPPEAGGFTIREMGVFDDAGQLIAICNTPDTQKAGIADGAVQELRLNMKIELSNMDAITLTVDPAASVSKAEMEAHQNDTGKHITPEERSKWNAKQDAMTVDSALSGTSTNPVQNKAVKAALDGKSGTGHTHTAASTTVAGFLSAADKRKLNGIDESANAYTHPSTHPATMISQDAAHRFVTDAEKQAWDALYAQLVAYTDGAIADLIGGAPATLDTLKEIADAIAANKSTEQALNEAVGKKANQTELDTHTGNRTIHVTATERQKWNAKQDAMTVDSALSGTSTNPVQNKAVKNALDGLKGVVGAEGTRDVGFTYPGRPWGEKGSMSGMSIASALQDMSNKMTDALFGITPGNIGAASSEYLNENYVAGFTLSNKIPCNTAGWVRIAKLSATAETSATHSAYTSCTVIIKRSWMNSSPDYHAVRLLVGGGDAKFVSIAHKNTNAVTKMRYTYDEAGGAAYIEIYYALNGINHIRYFIDGGAGIDGNVWDITQPAASEESPSGVKVLASLDFPTNFDASMLVEKGYLESHFVPDYVSRESASFSGPGWKKVAVINDGAAAGVPCVVSIKRSYGNTPGESHKIQFLNCYGRYGFASLAGISHTQLVKKMRLVINADGKSYIEAYYEGKAGNASDIAIEGAVTVLGQSRYCWEALPLEDDAETPEAGTVTAVYDIPANFDTDMLAMADGSNVNGMWRNLSSGTVYGEYTQDGGSQPPAYIPKNRVKFNMMRQFKGLPDISGAYMDCMLMDCYEAKDIPCVTAFGMSKGSAIPRAFIAIGGKGNTTNWKAQAELVTTANISMVGIARSDEAMGRHIVQETANKNFGLLAAAGMYGVSGAGGKVSEAPVIDGYGHLNWSVAVLDCGRGKKLQAAAAMYDRDDDKTPAGVWLRELGDGAWFRIDALGACREREVFNGDIELDETGSQFAWADATDGFGGNYLKSMGGDGESRTEFMHLRTYGYACDLSGAKFHFVTEHVITLTDPGHSSDSFDTDAAVGAPVMAGGRNFGSIEYCGTAGNYLTSIALSARKSGDQMDAASIHVARVEFLYSA